MTRADIAKMACGRVAVESFRRRRVPSRSDGHRLLLCDVSFSVSSGRARVTIEAF